MSSVNNNFSFQKKKIYQVLKLQFKQKSSFSVTGNEHYPKVSPAQFSAAFHGYELPQKECRADEVDSNEVKFYLYTRYMFILL